MGHIVERFGSGIGYGRFVLLLIVPALAGTACRMGPAREPPPDVELVALDNGQPAVALEVAGTRAADGDALRFAVPLAARNRGTGAVVPRRVALSVPGRFWVAGPGGVRLPAEVTPGVALHRHVIELEPVPLPPDGEPHPLPGLELVLLEPDLPRYSCTARGDIIPEFIPAPALDPRTLANVLIFYSVELNGYAGRSTGLLTVRLDPAQLEVAPAPLPPVFPATTLDVPDTRPPDPGVLRFAGTRAAWCGDPEQPMTLFTALFEGPGGARAYAIHVDGRARKRLYDLTGDGVIDLETWDADGDGRFDTRRRARFAVPGFLVPLPPRNPQLREPITTPPDSAWLALFHDVAAGPFRFARWAAQQPPPPEPAAAAAPAARPPPDTVPRPDTVPPPDTIPPPPDTVPPPDTIPPPPDTVPSVSQALKR